VSSARIGASDGGTLTAEHGDSNPVKMDAPFADCRRHRRNATWHARLRGRPVCQDCHCPD